MPCYGEVTFDKPLWEGKAVYSKVVEDFHLIAKSITSLSKEERRFVNDFNLDFEKLLSLLTKYGYNRADEISARLIELYSEQNRDLKEEIEQLSRKKLMNDASDKLTYMLGMIPSIDTTDKVLKYERSLQKSIFQNIIMLKKLQGLF